ncbi:cubilin-like isoform X2 [Pomacea canaliculata]|uniref:cubilin-like isoform X2 n=1 Tax=Pomacea canaliculata TaxID=400727 RepID=UPI000D728702|nr:cubilin-like isoform X2 [Pomacea canaliculata]
MSTCKLPTIVPTTTWSYLTCPSSAHSLGKVCQSTSRDFYSSASSMGSSIGSSMYIKFRSDAITAGRGFMLTYQAVPRSSLPTTTASTCSRYPPPLTARRYNEEYLQYPTTSSSYPSNVDCGWVLVTTFDNYVVHVTFTFVNVEYASYCPYDYIEVFDGSSDVTNSLGRLCGSQVGDFYSSGQSMYIKFHSDASTSGGGFRLTYKAVSTWDVPKPSASVSPAVVVGAVVGSIAFLIAVVVVAVTCRRRRLQQSTRNPPINTNNNQPIVYFYPPNGSALQTGPPSFLPGPPAVMAGPPSVFAVPPSVIASPPSLNTGPPSYDFLVQGARYPGVSGQVVHTSSMPQFPVTGPAPSASPGARVSKF